MKTLLKVVLSLWIAVAMGGCGESAPPAEQGANAPQQTYKWKLVTSWPKNFPGLGQAPETFANMINEMSGGRLIVTVYGAGELVPGFEVFDAVAQGTAQMGHSGAYYWKGKMPAAPIFSAIPFGMNAQEMNGWLHYGGGLKLWQELYAPFGVVPFAGGNTGVQMAGWFKKEINSLEDFQGLKMRIPGLGGEVLKAVGGIPVTLTGGEIFTSLQTGAIDATEWVGPYNDLAFGLYRAADYYYHSGWHEPGTQLEFLVNQEALQNLPADLQAMVKVAMRAANQDMLDEYTARNNAAMESLINEHNVTVRSLPDDVLAALRQASEKVMAEQAASDEDFKQIYASYLAFYAGVKKYHALSEQAYYNNR
ncbi:TRAP transporter substrate-binding protein [Alteromonas gilva]|uniref:TRAP transporter substrate-binding protein n=1 Tax=Alteromonas gilva TaxID=2987522 RepID=A0ABT5L8J9_9ALTE|nr:TRAP transporter substrate-binding protein [Alteromonas gilva]MDC8832252.1 TRAP transporter substrate-binding protein [Alteromonas gilva]